MQGWRQQRCERQRRQQRQRWWKQRRRRRRRRLRCRWIFMSFSNIVRSALQRTPCTLASHPADAPCRHQGLGVCQPARRSRTQTDTHDLAATQVQAMRARVVMAPVTGGAGCCWQLLQRWVRPWRWRRGAVARCLPCGDRQVCGVLSHPLQCFSRAQQVLVCKSEACATEELQRPAAGFAGRAALVAAAAASTGLAAVDPLAAGGAAGGAACAWAALRLRVRIHP